MAFTTFSDERCRSSISRLAIRGHTVKSLLDEPHGSSTIRLGAVRESAGVMMIHGYSDQVSGFRSKTATWIFLAQAPENNGRYFLHIVTWPMSTLSVFPTGRLTRHHQSPPLIHSLQPLVCTRWKDPQIWNLLDSPPSQLAAALRNTPLPYPLSALKVE